MKEQYFYVMVVAVVIIAQVCITGYAVLQWQKWEQAYKQLVLQLRSNDKSIKKTIVAPQFHAPKSERDIHLSQTLVRPI